MTISKVNKKIQINKIIGINILFALPYPKKPALYYVTSFKSCTFQICTGFMWRFCTYAQLLLIEVPPKLNFLQMFLSVRWGHEICIRMCRACRIYRYISTDLHSFHW